MKLKPNTAAGFTLLEIIIATVIMAFISIFTAQMIQQGIHARAKIREEVDRTSSLRDALGLVTQDIQKAFNYQDINIELYNAAQTQRQQTANNPNNPAAPGSQQPTTNPAPGANPANPAAPTNPGGPVDPNKFKLKTPKTFTRFMGEKDKLNFTSLNNYRNTKNLQQSDQCEIGYYVDSCRMRDSKAKETQVQCLWRRLSPYIDEDVTDGGDRSVILEDVKSLQFRYLGHGHEEEWVESWMSEKGEEAEKGRLPMAVEVTVTIYDRRTSPPKEVAMTVVATPRFLNDPPPPKTQTDANGNPLPTQPGAQPNPGLPGGTGGTQGGP